MALLERLTAILDADLSGLIRGLDRATREAASAADDIVQKFDRAGMRLQQVGTRMTLGITAPLVAFGGLSVKAASDAEELRNLIGELFGDSADDVEEWADRTARALNRSGTNMLRMTGDFAKFLKPLLDGDEAFDQMSRTLAQLTTDLSSFQNVAEEEVAQRLFSGLAGETEAVRRLGIDIGQVALEAELMSLGFKGNAQEASQAQKAVARYNLILKNTQDAQGDAARTAGSFENQSRALSAAFLDLREEIGNQLLPAMTKLTRAATGAIRGFLNLDASTKRTIVRLGLLTAAVGPGLVVFGTMVRVLAFAGRGLIAFSRVVVATSKTVITALARMAAPFISLPGLAVGAVALAVAFRGTLTAMFDGLGNVVRRQFVNHVQRPLLQSLTLLRDNLPGKGQEMFDAIFGEIEVPSPVEEAGNTIRDALLAAARESGRDVERFKAQVDDLVSSIEEKFPQAAAIIRGVASGVTDLADIDALTGKITGLLDGLAAKGGATGESLEDAFKPILELPDEVVESTSNAKELLDVLGEGVGSAFEAAVSQGKSLGDVLKGLEQDLIRLATRQLITQPLMGAIGGLFPSAKGNAFQGGRVTPFARGGVVDRPTLFPMARGAGLMGERGPEAVVPLQRTSSGDLGVAVAGGGGAGSGSRVTVNVVNNAQGTQVTQSRSRRGPDMEEITVMIDRAVGDALERPGSRSHRAIKRTFGASVQTTAR